MYKHNMVLHHIDDMGMLGFPINNLDTNLVVDFKALQLTSNDEDETFPESVSTEETEESFPNPTPYSVSTMTILTGVTTPCVSRDAQRWALTEIY